jgi:hypothetical protein
MDIHAFFIGIVSHGQFSLFVLKGLGINDFSAKIIHICCCQYCSHSVALLLSCWNFSLCGRNNDTYSCNCSVPNLARQSEWDDTSVWNLILRLANLQCSPSSHLTASLTFFAWPVHGRNFVSMELLLLKGVISTTVHSKPSCDFHFSHFINNHSGTVVGEDRAL